MVKLEHVLELLSFISNVHLTKWFSLNRKTSVSFHWTGERLISAANTAVIREKGVCPECPSDYGSLEGSGLSFIKRSYTPRLGCIEKIVSSYNYQYGHHSWTHVLIHISVLEDISSTATHGHLRHNPRLNETMWHLIIRSQHVETYVLRLYSIYTYWCINCNKQKH